MLYTIYIGEFGSRWLLFIEAKLQQKRNNNAPPLVCSSAAHSSKQASKQSGRPSVRAYSAHWSETHQTTCATLLLHEQMASTNVEQNYDDRPPLHYTTTTIPKLHITCDFSPYLSRDWGGKKMNLESYINFHAAIIHFLPNTYLPFLKIFQSR